MWTYEPYTPDPRDHSNARFMTTGGYTFATEDAAKEFVGLHNEYFAAQERVATAMPTNSRADYEAACVALGAEVLTDAQCNDYGVRWGDFGPWATGHKVKDWTVAYATKYLLAKRRAAGIDAEGGLQAQQVTILPPAASTEPTAEAVAEQLGVDALRERAERIHHANPGIRGELHAIWCTGHAAMQIANEKKVKYPAWWSEWKRGGELEKLMHIVNPHTPVHASAVDDLTLCDCGHYTQRPMSTSSGSACPDCYDRMENA